MRKPIAVAAMMLMLAASATAVAEEPVKSSDSVSVTVERADHNKVSAFVNNISESIDGLAQGFIEWLYSDSLL